MKLIDKLLFVLFFCWCFSGYGMIQSQKSWTPKTDSYLGKMMGLQAFGLLASSLEGLEQVKDDIDEWGKIIDMPDIPRRTLDDTIACAINKAWPAGIRFSDDTEQEYDQKDLQSYCKEYPALVSQDPILGQEKRYFYKLDMHKREFDFFIYFFERARHDCNLWLKNCIWMLEKAASKLHIEPTHRQIGQLRNLYFNNIKKELLNKQGEARESLLKEHAQKWNSLPDNYKQMMLNELKKEHESLQEIEKYI